MKNKYLSFLILFALLIISTKKNNAQIIPLTDGNIQEAVHLWFMHQSLAEDTYGPINQWDTSNVTDMSNLFSGRTFFNEPIGNWDVSNVTNMNSMFVGCDHFDQTLAFWNVSKVIDMGHMFKHTTFFNQPIGNWDVGNVINMSYMFYNADNFNQYLANWDVSSVINMHKMFRSAESFNQPLDNWEVNNVTDMYQMFWGAYSFNQPLGNWNVSNVTDMSSMFSWVTLSTKNYDSILQGWASLPSLQLNVNFDGGLSNYCNGATSREYIINTYGWTITDGGLDCSSLGIDETKELDLSIYPNPTNNLIYILGIKTQFDVLIYNGIGKKMMHKKAINEIDVSSLSNGVYFIKLSDGINTSTKKFIKY